MFRIWAYALRDTVPEGQGSGEDQRDEFQAKGARRFNESSHFVTNAAISADDLLAFGQLKPAEFFQIRSSLGEGQRLVPDGSNSDSHGDFLPRFHRQILTSLAALSDRGAKNAARSLENDNGISSYGIIGTTMCEGCLLE
jgi:hypothetical protein